MIKVKRKVNRKCNELQGRVFEIKISVETVKHFDQYLKH